MRNALLAILLLFMTACTSSHRIVAVYESGDAVSTPVRILEKPAALPAKAVEVQDEKPKEDSGNIFTDMLP